jgi:hypothetical protein
MLMYKFYGWPVLLAEIFKLAELGGSGEIDMRGWLVLVNLYRAMKERVEMIHAENIDDFQIGLGISAQLTFELAEAKIYISYFFTRAKSEFYIFDYNTKLRKINEEIEGVLKMNRNEYLFENIKNYAKVIGNYREDIKFLKPYASYYDFKIYPLLERSIEILDENYGKLCLEKSGLTLRKRQ